MAVSREARIEAVRLLIAQGWNPPRPNDTQTDRLIDSIGWVSGAHPTAKLTLSPTERQVVALAGQGFTRQETADELGIGIETVKERRQDICRRLGAKNMAHAVMLAMQRGEIAA